MTTRTKAQDLTDEERQAMQRAYDRGQTAFREYASYSDNPYDYRKQPGLSDQWCNGWLDAEAEAHPVTDNSNFR